MQSEYVGEVEARDELMTIEKFKACVESGLFIDYDGFGYTVKFIDGIPKHSEVVVRPSRANSLDFADATHVVWYNR